MKISDHKMKINLINLSLSSGHLNGNNTGNAGVFSNSIQCKGLETFLNSVNNNIPVSKSGLNWTFRVQKNITADINLMQLALELF